MLDYPQKIDETLYYEIIREALISSYGPLEVGIVSIIEEHYAGAGGHIKQH